MARKIQFKRGPKSRLAKLSPAEMAFTDDEKKLYVGDGNENIRLLDEKDKTELTTQLAETEPLYAATKTKEEVDIFLVYGQSNAMGYAANTVGDPKFKTPNVSVWNGTAEIPLSNYMPTSQGENSTGGAWVAFANEYARKTGRKAIIANCAKSSQSIADLSKGASNTLYSNLVKWGNDIKSYITNSGKIVGKISVLWCQGETDIVAQTSRASYETAISTLWTNIKKDIGAESFNIFTVGFYNDDTKKYGWQIQNAQRNFSKANADVYIIFDSIDSLAGNNMKVDGVHLNQRGYNLMGEVGAKNYCESALLKSSNESLPLISRNGTINLDGTQEWQLFGGWIRKVNGAWAVSSQSARAITGIQSATESNGSLLVTLSNKIDYILFEEAKLSHGLPEATNNQVINANVIPLTYQTIDTNGNTNVVIHFYSDIVLTVDLAEQTFNTDLMGIDLSGLFTAAFGVGGVTFTHQNVKTGVTATVYNADNTPRFISVNPISKTQTNIRVFDTTGTLSNSKITCIFKDMKIPVDKIPSGDANAQNPELMLSVIGAKRQGS